MVIRAHTHGASVVLFARIYLVDAAAFSVGRYCGVFESGYREVEWAVLVFTPRLDEVNEILLPKRSRVSKSVSVAPLIFSKLAQPTKLRA